MTDLVIGMGDDVGLGRDYHFIQSVKKSGFQGELHVIEEDPLPWHPVVDRWKLIADYIRKGDYDRVIACDTFDVVFQYNPFEWLDKHQDNFPLVLTSEERQFKDCEGNKKGMLEAFPQFWENIKDHWIVNAGVIAGRAEPLANLCRDIYDLCQQDARLPKFTPGFQDRLPDQQALNLLKNSRDRIIVGGEAGWAFQYNHAHTVKEGEVYNVNGQKYAIFHQYLYQWKNDVQKRFS
jgi:hypothetical protein